LSIIFLKVTSNKSPNIPIINIVIQITSYWKYFLATFSTNPIPVVPAKNSAATRVPQHIPTATLIPVNISGKELGNITYLNIPGGVDPIPSKLPLTTVGIQLMEGNRSFFSLSEIFDLSARGKLDLAFLSGAQIDSFGNINLSFIGESEKPKTKFPGGAGSAMLLPTAKRVVLWRTVHTKRTFPKDCSFITAAGNVDKIVTPLCIFKKTERNLSLHSKHYGTDEKSLRECTGFDIGSFENCPETVEPSSEEIAALNQVDPCGIRYREFD